MSTLLAEPFSCVADVGAMLGEGPLWDERDARLYFVDIKGGAVFRYDPAARDSMRFEAGPMVSAIAPARTHQFVCAYRDGFAYLDIEGARAVLTPIADPEKDTPGNRFNDGKLDPDGRFWAGTMDDAEAERRGAFWRLDPGGAVARMAENYRVANGPAFDPEARIVYLVDSADRRIIKAPLTQEGMGAPSPFKVFEAAEGYPDGVTVDNEGCLWAAFWDGACLRRLSREGEVLEVFPLPVSRPTSLTIAGEHIYVTSAAIGLDAKALEKEPQAGGLFAARLSRPLGRSPAPVFEG